MKIQELFERPIRRNINGVIKADQNDAASVWQELDEYVVTKELDQHFRRFFDSYLAALQRPEEAAGKVGVWISGFFGSGKSHFLKILSYLLENREVTHEGQTRKAAEFFRSKITDAMLVADIERAVSSDTDVLLFNIDSKADAADGRDTVLRVFLKVFNEKLGYCGDHAHIAHMERMLSAKGVYDRFRAIFEADAGESWEAARDAYSFHLDAFGKALSEALGQAIPDAEAWMQRFETDFSLTVENFAEWIRDYLDKQGKSRRLVFLVDEIGQFVGKDTQLMLSLQTITENLGTVCGGRAWVVVTSQEDIDAVIGEVRASRANDFSKIQGRFKTRLSLSSANVDEVIQARLLAKPKPIHDQLTQLYSGKADILSNQLSFVGAGRTFRAYGDQNHFAEVYPFAPYQFQLVQRIFESIRKAGATGLHLARGERSLLDAFQSAATAVAEEEVGILVPLHRFYSSIESFLEGVVKSTIDNASRNVSLKPFDVLLLKTLFLIRYVDELKGNVDNLITLFIDRIDADRLALRNEIEASLQRLEKETLVARNGDDFFFLTNEERDVSREIKEVDLSSADEAKELGKLVFEEVLKGIRKHRYPVNRKDFGLNLTCDGFPHGRPEEGNLPLQVISPLNDEHRSFDEPRCIMASGNAPGSVIVRMSDDEALARELRLYLQTDRYVSRKADNSLPSATQKILRERTEENRQRRGRLSVIVERLIKDADYYAAGQKPNLKGSAPQALVDEALGYFVANTFSKLGYIEHLNPDPQKEAHTLIATHGTAGLDLETTSQINPRALKELSQLIALQTQASRRIVLHDLTDGHFARRPYGWPEWETLLLVVRLVLQGELTLIHNNTALKVEELWPVLNTPSRWRSVEVQKRQAMGSAELQKARQLMKDLFHQIGPDGEDALYAELRRQLSGWKAELEKWKLMSQNGYPGGKAIAAAMEVVNRQLAAADSYAAISGFLAHQNDLRDAGDTFHELKDFFGSQKEAWDRLKLASQHFGLNRSKLEKDAQASPALQRIELILNADAPYGLLREADGLISTVEKANNDLLEAARLRALANLEKSIDKVQAELELVKADADLRNRSLKPLQDRKAQIGQQLSLAHLFQLQDELQHQADEAIDRIHAWQEAQRKVAPQPSPVPPAGGSAGIPSGEPIIAPAFKKPHILRAAQLASTAYISSDTEAEAFLEKLRAEMMSALKRGERVEIR
ncbi:MAG: hypothetical protein CMK02_07435 [Polycyclovorans sp.]|nr:hypothetical protein [Polycyclovorans sp.]|tara:strand:- start:15291 stop:18902 length:3612 start_codon:yes stop_codon:yes gene_type:complete